MVGHPVWRGKPRTLASALSTLQADLICNMITSVELVSYGVSRGN